MTKAGARSATTVIISLAFVLPGLGLMTPALASAGGTAAAAQGACTPGARTLSRHGDHVYPDTGNGGYTSLHTDVRLVYSATANRFLRGNHVTLTDRATQCLTQFSLDLERKSLANVSDGPDLRVGSVVVNGHPAAFSFAQPTYPGDPHGVADPDPRAHEASQNNPVGGPHHNPLPPACSPQLTSTSYAKRNAQNGQQCPANKLVITPAAPITTDPASPSPSTTRAGRGAHRRRRHAEGWFRSNKPAGDGGFVTTEPVGTED